MSAVPRKFQPFLPSSPVANLEVQRDKRYILQNLIKNASLEAWKWMTSTYSEAEIAEVIRTTRHFHEKDVRFWSYYLDIPEKEIKCLQNQSQSTFNSSWAY